MKQIQQARSCLQRLSRSRLAQAAAVAVGVVGAFQAHAQAPTPAALPTGSTVRQGQASITVNNGLMTITNSRNAAIDWQSFNIGSASAVHFQQPDALSQVLNRVVGVSPTSILGRMSSNGGVWLFNPQGVLFGANARVDVAQIVASSLRLDLDDWRRGSIALSAGSAGAVRNEGHIEAAVGGRVVLAGTDVFNSGTIHAPRGSIFLLAGRAVVLDQLAQGNTVAGNGAVTAPGGSVSNTGLLDATGGGLVKLQATAINHTGVARATALQRGAGGSIELIGAQVSVEGQGVLDASGADGGGSIRVVGDRAHAAQADAPAGVYVAAGATLRADAVQAGEGGRVLMLGADAARIYGSLSAAGGARSGNGGFVETSANWLDVRPQSIQLGAPAGIAGRWLIDPHDLQIVQTVAGVPPIGPVFNAGADSTVIGANQIAAGLVSGNVTITTGTTGTQAGDITMSGVDLQVTTPVARTLTLEAARNIDLLNSTIRSIGPAVGAVALVSPLSIELRAGQGGAGAVNLRGATLQANGGDVLLAGSSFSTSGTTVIGANTIRVLADRVNLGLGSTLSATATGGPLSTITFAGRTGSLESFASQTPTATAGGSVTLNTAAGSRWLIAATSPATTSLGTLLPSFRQYAAGLAATPAETGNGVLHTAAPVLSLAPAAAGPVVTRTYDGTTAAPQPAAAPSLVGFAQADETAALPDIAYSFVSPDAGASVPLLASLPRGLTPVTAPAGVPGAPLTAINVYGYTFDGTGLTGRINPGTLTVTARPATGVAGIAIPTIIGEPVQGFVGNDNQANATTGTLMFTTTATLASPPGTYSATGSGLTARNYTIVQNRSNATAVTLLDGGTATIRNDDPVQPNLPVPRPPTGNPRPPVHWPVTDNWPTDGPIFNDPAKDWLLGPLKSELDANPGLASLRPCSSARAGLTGTCLITPDQRAGLLRELDAPAAFTELMALLGRLPPPATRTEAPPRGSETRVSYDGTTLITLRAGEPGVLNTRMEPVRPSFPPDELCAYSVDVRNWDCISRKLYLGSLDLQNLPTCDDWRQAVNGGCRLDAKLLEAVRVHVVVARGWQTALAPAPKPSLPEINRKHALLLGIGNYPKPMQLEAVQADLTRLCRVLTNDFGYNAKILLNPTREEIVASMNRLYADMQPKDSALVHFIGHGFHGAKDGYWITGGTVQRSADGRVQVDPKTVITNADIVGWMKGFEARQVMLLADSAFRDGNKRDVTIAATSDIGSLLVRDSAVAWASGRNEPVSGRHASVYTESLIKSMNQVGASWELGSKVTGRVSGILRAEGLQTMPRYLAVEGSSSVDYVFERRQPLGSNSPESICRP